MSVRMLVVSDTHYKIDNLYFAVDEAGEIDGLIHLGDIEDYRSEVEEMVDCPCYIVPGNNDYFSGMSRERILEIGDHRILLTHGHRYQPYFSRTRLMEAAEGEGCDIVLYGHTHVPMVEEEGGITAANPGSLTWPRQRNGLPSYMIMEIRDDNSIEFEIRYL